MGDISETLENVPINDVAMAGTHDSGTFGICRHSPNGGDAPCLLSLFLGGAYIGSLDMAPTARTQGGSWTQQLLAGARYFDLRLTHFAGEKEQLAGYYFTHTWIGERFDAMLRDTAEFLETHPKEIIILDFQHIYDFSDDDYTIMFGKLQETFGNKLASHQSFGPTSTVGEFMTEGCQVIPILQEDEDDGNASMPPEDFFQENPWLWPRSSNLCSIWSQKNSKNDLLEFLNDEINNK